MRKRPCSFANSPLPSGHRHTFSAETPCRQRTEQSVIRNSIVGTAVRNTEYLPKHSAADEKHTSVQGERGCAAAVAPGVSVADSAGEEALKEACGIYKEEAVNAGPDYAPETVGTDRTEADSEIPFSVRLTLILCFLRVFIGIRVRAKKKFGEICHEVAPKLWDCCQVAGRASYPQKVRQFREVAEKVSHSVTADRTGRLRENIADFVACNFPGAHRTGNVPDRPMRRPDRHLSDTRFFTVSSLPQNPVSGDGGSFPISLPRIRRL